MKFIKFFFLGTLFGLIMAKAEIISWYRIYEMFNFQSFHMYGIIGSAILIGIVGTRVFNYTAVKSTEGEDIDFGKKENSLIRYIIGGTIFGLGWALSGACPGPMFVLVGFGYFPILIVIFGALLGTFLYGLLRKHLPH